MSDGVEGRFMIMRGPRLHLPCFLPTSKYFSLMQNFISRIHFQYIIKAQQKGLVLWSGPFVGQKASVCCICTQLSALELFPLGQSKNPTRIFIFYVLLPLSSLQQLCKLNQSCMSSIDESAAGLTRLLQTQR